MSQPHFTARHYEGEASGPFSFLNPTVRKRPLQLNKPNSSQEDLQRNVDGQSTENSGAKGETRAEDVQEKWTSRNNRKGDFPIPPCRA